MITVQLSDSDLEIIREIVLPELEAIPGGDRCTDEQDEALWTFITKLKEASDQ
jgi:hypothetical protein